jgi:TPP-dependent pyruvate/acetoin dehydrogenase alpha subunit
VPNIATRAQGFGFSGVTVDGRDFYAVLETVGEAVARARGGDGPTLIEAKTVRWSRHSAVAAGGSGADADRWKQTDPIPRFRQELVSRGILTEEQAAQIEQDARREIDEAVQFAIQSPFPALDEMYTDIFA